MIKPLIAKLVEGIDLTEAEMTGAVGEIMEGRVTDAQIGAFITALRIKGETPAEITGAARAMIAKATPIPRQPPIPRQTPIPRASPVPRPAASGLSGTEIVDTCGTGGDGTHTFNISTAAAFVAAGAGVTVAKHGNRSVSSTCGSADVCESLGVPLHLPPERIGECLATVGIAFLFAPDLHGAMKYAIGPRREIGLRTIFNVLGPLTNPAGATAQLLGVYARHLTGPLAEVLGRLGCRRALVVHGGDGLDEITITGKTFVAELRDGEVTASTIEPGDVGLSEAPMSAISGGGPEENARLVREILSGAPGPRRDIVLFNAGAAVYVAGKAGSLAEGVEAARAAIDDGRALAKLEGLTSFGKTDESPLESRGS